MPARRSALLGGVTTAPTWLSPLAQHVASSDRVLAAFLCDERTEDDKGLEKGKEEWGVRKKLGLPTRSPIVLAFPAFGPRLIRFRPDRRLEPVLPPPSLCGDLASVISSDFVEAECPPPITPEDTDAPSNGDKCPLLWQYSPERHAQQLLWSYRRSPSVVSLGTRNSRRRFTQQRKDRDRVSHSSSLSIDHYDRRNSNRNRVLRFQVSWMITPSMDESEKRRPL